MQQKVLFKNFKAIIHGCVINHADVLVEDSKIVAIGTGFTIGDEDLFIIDGGGELYLSAGFIDIHVHGGGGFDFMDADVDEYVAIAKHHAKYGTTAFYPTTLTATHEELLASVQAFADAKNIPGGAKMLGMHMEGPYIAKSQKGAMDENYIRDPIPEEYEQLCDIAGDIKRITAAPELPGAAELGKYLNSRDILPSIGHTDAVCADVIQAFNEGGFRLMTHLYSAMSMTRRINAYRFAGVVEAAYLLDDMYVEIIADGIHLPKELLQLIYKIKGSDRIAIITDAMRASGMEGGTAMLGSRKNGFEVLIEDGVAKLMDRTAFAGSIATADRLIRTMMNLAEIPLTEAVKMITETPAKIMDIYDERGSLESGKFADIAVFDENINVKLTMVEGEIVHNILWEEKPPRELYKTSCAMCGAEARVPFDPAVDTRPVYCAECFEKIRNQ